MPNENPLRILVITSRPLTDGAGNPIVLLDVEEERRRLRVALDLSPSTTLSVSALPELACQNANRGAL